MFLKTFYLIWRWSDGRTKLQAVINFMDESKFNDFINTPNKRYWLMRELNLPECYFWNTYLEEPDDYIANKNEYLLDKELEEADMFDIK